jgi:hypothetical protein
VHCWHDGPAEADGMSTTCMELDGHEGPHKFVRDDTITISFPPLPSQVSE